MNKILKSGTDIRGIVVKNKKEEVTLFDKDIKELSKAFAIFVYEKYNKPNLTIAVGYDSRISSKHISEIVIKTLCDCGVTVLNSSLSSTPSMFMMTKFKETNCDASIMITASHLPYYFNGLKFFTKDGGLDGKDIDTLMELSSSDWNINLGKGKVITKNYMKLYEEHIINIIKKETKEDKPFKGIKILVDAGNGVGGFYANKILKKLGANISSSMYLEPDGRFPNHIPNPEDKDAMASISKYVVEKKSDIGIIFDTDCDRAAVVDNNGKSYNKNQLIALISSILLKKYKGAYIVTDCVTSDALTKFIKDKGGNHIRFKRGYRNVINKAIELNKQKKNCVLAIETSGHAALKENYFLDDGAYLVTKLLIEYVNQKKKDSSLWDITKDLKEPIDDVDISMPVFGKDYFKITSEILKNFDTYARKQNNLVLAKDNSDNVKCYIKGKKASGWFLVRASVHNPTIYIKAESFKNGFIIELLNEASKYFKKHGEGIDTTPLKKYL